MRSQLYILAVLSTTLLLAGCTGTIELVGYGVRPELQHGLQVRLVSNGDDGALIQILNTSSNIVSVNQSPLAFAISVKAEGKPVEPTGYILAHRAGLPRPDDFVIIAPGQTRTIPVRISSEKDQFHTLDKIYTIEKGILYDVEVELHPFFGLFQKENADKILSEYKIPNYLDQTLKMNTMTIRVKDMM